MTTNASGDRTRSAVGLGLEAVSVRYGEALVLDRVDLEVAPGEVVGVVGPSGSGKSTLLRAVAGLEPLAGGGVSLGGRDLAGVPTHQRGLGLMFQDHGLFTHLDVAANVGYGLRVGGRSDAGRAARVTELLDLVGLTGMGERAVDRLSGGEAQRVALARALAPAPGLLMLDEPLGSLDRALREELTVELRRLLGELGQTALHVTHDQGEAFALADRVAVLSAGRLVAVDRPADLWADPGTPFVARFLGHPNLWTVEVDGAGVVSLAGTPIGRLADDHPVRRHGPGAVEVVLPATAIDVDATGSVEVLVDEVVFDRGRHRVSGRLGTGGPSAAVPVEFDTVLAASAGDRCPIRLDVDRLRPLGPDAEPAR
ncbi:MAG: ABC transporter ATP-binding protein [Actinomycetota bacterium]